MLDSIYLVLTNESQVVASNAFYSPTTVFSLQYSVDGIEAVTTDLHTIPEEHWELSCSTTEILTQQF